MQIVRKDYTLTYDPVSDICLLNVPLKFMCSLKLDQIMVVNEPHPDDPSFKTNILMPNCNDKFLPRYFAFDTAPFIADITSLLLHKIEVNEATGRIKLPKVVPDNELIGIEL